MSRPGSSEPSVDKKTHVKYVRQPSSKKLIKTSKSNSVEVDGPSPENRSDSEEDYLKLYTRKWPVPDHVATVYILHGFGEHCERYEGFIKLLNDNKCSVATHDHVGHGLSDGIRVHVDHFNIYVHDALELIKQCKLESNDNKPFILFGHSMGGLMATLCMLEAHELFTAAVLSSPCLKVHEKYNKAPLRWLARALSFIYPTFYIPSKSLALDPADVIADEVSRQLYEEDPLVWHYQSRAGGTTAMFDAITKAQRNLLNLKVKCFVQHGACDLVCDPEGVQPFSKIPEVVTLKIYPGAKHALFMDTHEIRNEALQDCITFINSVVESH